MNREEKELVEFIEDKGLSIFNGRALSFLRTGDKDRGSRRGRRGRGYLI